MKKISREDIRHHPNCTSDYPEKVYGEDQIYESNEGGFTVLTCVDCGASVDNFPPENDPYWDDVR